jgi:choline kinase
MDEKTTTAIILCAGRGGRLRPLTDDRPKCLLGPGGRPIIERCLDSLRDAGIRQTVLVTGYRAEMVEGFVKEKRYAGVRFIRNPDFPDTNTAVSLHLALRTVDADVLVINGDVLFDPAVLGDLLAVTEPNAVVVDREAPLGAEGVKVMAKDGRLTRIGKDLDPRFCLGEAIGLNRIGRRLLPGLVRIYGELEGRAERGHFFEKGFDVLAGNGDGSSFGLSFTRGRPWIEIDTLEDFAHAERDIVPRLSA